MDVADDRFTMEYRMVSEAQQEVVADGAGVIVSFDYVKRVKTRIPDAVRKAIADLEKKATSR